MSFDTQKLALQALAGHGHVKPRPDGVRMRCGGPAVCRVCQQEKAELETSQRINEAFHPLDGQHINQGSVDAATEAYEREFLQAKIDTQAAEIERLREALQKVRPVIAEDRQGLLDCHGINGKIPAEDELGTYGLYEYDGALHVIDAALSGEPNA